MQYGLVNFVSGYVHLAESKLVMIFVIQNVHQICVEWMNILSVNSSNTIMNKIQLNILLNTFLMQKVMLPNHK